MGEHNINIGLIQIWDRMEVLEQEVASILTKNENLFKLLKYTDRYPLSHELEEMDVENMLLEFDGKFQPNPDCRIFFEPFNDNAVESETAMIRIYPLQINPTTVYVGDLFLQIDIIVHQSISKISGGRRRNRILAEVLKSLNGKNIKLVQELRLVDKPIALRQFKKDYWGYSLIMQTGVSAIG